MCIYIYIQSPAGWLGERSNALRIPSEVFAGIHDKHLEAFSVRKAFKTRSRGVGKTPYRNMRSKALGCIRKRSKAFGKRLVHISVLSGVW